MKRVHALPVVVVALVAFLTGCMGRIVPSRPPGTASLAVETVLPAEVVEQTNQAELILRQDSRELRYDVPIEDRSFRFVVGSLYEGNWEITLHIIDSEGDVVYRAVADVPLLSNQTTVAQLDLVPAPGLLEVYIDLSTFHDKDRVGRARISVSPGGYSSAIREDGSDVIHITREVAPRTYDFRVSLYGDEYSNAIYNSPWRPVDIRPGKVTTVIWSVSTGDLQVVGEVHPAPGRPEALRAEPVEDGSTLRLTWGPGSNAHYAIAYRIYERSTPFDYFRMIQEVPGDTFEWMIDASRLTTPHTRVYAVSAVSSLGFESLRSEPVVVEFPLTSK